MILTRYVYFIKILAKEFETIENTACDFPTGRSIADEESLTFAEAEVYCNSNATCKMFFAPDKSVDNYYLCPYGSITVQSFDSDVYLKPRKRVEDIKASLIYQN